MNLKEFRRLLEVTLLLPLTLLLLLALVLAWQIRRTLSEQQRIDHSDRIASELNETERLIIDQETGLHEYQLTHDPDLLDPYKAAAAPLATTLNKLQRLVKGDADQERRLRQLDDSRAVWLGLANQVVGKVKPGEAPEDASLNLNEKRLMDSMRSQVRVMIQNESERRHQEVRATDTQVRTLMTVLLASSVGIGFFLGLIMQKNLKKVSHAFQSSLDEAHHRADELFEHRQWLQAILESVGDGLIVSDGAGRVQFMNPVAQQLTGWSSEEAQGRTMNEIFRIVHQQTRQPAEDPTDQVRAQNVVAGLTNPSVLISKDGREFVIDDSAAPIRGAAGEVSGVVLVFRDVTEQRQTEAALLANEKLAIAGRLAASIAHEIHNPLDAVANLHYLIEHETDVVQQQRYLAMAQQELNRTLQISRAMLGLYREPKAAVEVDLRALLESVLLLLDRRLKDQKTSVELRLEANATVEGFPGELRQVFTNLITNAAEAAGFGGRIQIRLEPASPHNDRTGALVTISDSGAGIFEGIKDRLFQPFATTKGEHGTGLGLWVSRGIVEKHGGTLELTNSTESGYGGAAVRVYLPTGESSAASRLPVQETAPS